VSRLSGRPEFQPTPASQKALEDLALKARVAAALREDFRTREAGFGAAPSVLLIALRFLVRS
jgi:hypothetical protein